MSDLVLLTRHRHTSTITLNRADKRNALSRELIAELTAAFQAVKHDPLVHSVILTGNGPAFCAGMDLDELRKSMTAGPDQIGNDALRLAELFDLIYTLPKPTIAAVNGPAVAGGAGLMTVCDLALAVPTAKIGYPEVRRGLVAAIVLPHLLRHVGERAARKLLLTGELISAERACELQLINEIVSPDKLLEKAAEWANFCNQGGPQALATTKALLQQFSSQAMSVEAAAQASGAPRLGEECRAGLAAFFEQKPVPWFSDEI